MVAEEFEHIMELLTWSRLGKTPLGKKELVQLIAAIAFSPDDWHPEDPEYIDRIVQCSMHALPLFTVSWFCYEIPTSIGNICLELLYIILHNCYCCHMHKCFFSFCCFYVWNMFLI